jgi:hypothetical protein
MRWRRSLRYHEAMNLARIFALLCAILPSAAFAAELTFPPGSRIGLVPPAGMTAATTFQGFEDRTSGAVIVVTELSAQSAERVAEDFHPDRMKAGGLETVSRELIPLADGDGMLVVGRQEGQVTLHKWALITKTKDMTAIVVATFPAAASETYSAAAMRAVFSSVKLREKLTPDEMLAVLPYRLDDLGGFRLLRANPDGTAVLTFGGTDTTLPMRQPYFMVATRAVEPPPAAERESFAQRALTGFVSRPNLTIVRSEAMRIGNAQGFEIVAESPGDMGEDLMIVQWLRFGTTGVVQMFGMARKDRWEAVFPRMRALRDGFAPR